MEEFSSATVIRDLHLLFYIINKRIREWSLENIIRSYPVSFFGKLKTPRPRDRRLVSGEPEKILKVYPNPWFRHVVLFPI